MDKKYFFNYIIFLGLLVVLVLGFRWRQAGKPESQEPISEEQSQWEIEAVDEQGNKVELEVEPLNQTLPGGSDGSGLGSLENESSEQSGLQIEILEQGSGPAAKNGDTLAVHYTGTLLDSTQFDSSLDRGQPFEFTLGAGQVIQGWDQGLLGMKVGEKRKLTIPPELGYGPISQGLIPANAVLIFEVDLLSIE